MDLNAEITEEVTLFFYGSQGRDRSFAILLMFLLYFGGTAMPGIIYDLLWTARPIVELCGPHPKNKYVAYWPVVRHFAAWMRKEGCLPQLGSLSAATWDVISL